ncbi:hypothetical protein C8R46DRAFT_1116710 [Mycena filopes]|nr:hypothetical protein C8R46DRAFT_1116710 [Mycena filopes]
MLPSRTLAPIASHKYRGHVVYFIPSPHPHPPVMRTAQALSALFLAVVLEDEVAYDHCQTGCNNITATCYSAAGLVFGTVTADANAPVAALACNKVQSECFSNCTAVSVCQTGCNNMTVACYSAAGLVFGTLIADADAPVAALACNKAQGECSSNCTTASVVALEKPEA